MFCVDDAGEDRQAEPARADRGRHRRGADVVDHRRAHTRHDHLARQRQLDGEQDPPSAHPHAARRVDDRRRHRLEARDRAADDRQQPVEEQRDHRRPQAEPQDRHRQSASTAIGGNTCPKSTDADTMSRKSRPLSRVTQTPSGRPTAMVRPRRNQHDREVLKHQIRQRRLKHRIRLAAEKPHEHARHHARARDDERERERAQRHAGGGQRALADARSAGRAPVTSVASLTGPPPRQRPDRAPSPVALASAAAWPAATGAAWSRRRMCASPPSMVRSTSASETSPSSRPRRRRPAPSGSRARACATSASLSEVSGVTPASRQSTRVAAPAAAMPRSSSRQSTQPTSVPSSSVR